MKVLVACEYSGVVRDAFTYTVIDLLVLRLVLSKEKV